MDKAAPKLFGDFAAAAKIIQISETLLRNVTLQCGAADDLKAVTYCKGWDAADAVSDGWSKTQFDHLLSNAKPLESDNKGTTPAAPDTKASPSSNPDIDVRKTPDGESYVTLRLDGHFEHWPIALATFKKIPVIPALSSDRKGAVQTGCGITHAGACAWSAAKSHAISNK